MKTFPALTATTIAVALLTGCAPQAHTSPAAGMISPTSTASSGGPYDEATVLPVPEAAPESQQTGLAAGTKVMQAFAQPNLEPAAWMTQMTPLLSPTGYDAYLGTDPAQIPATRVTGNGTVLPGSTEVALIVQVPTDAGAYNIALSRNNPASPWLADQIRPAHT